MQKLQSEAAAMYKGTGARFGLIMARDANKIYTQSGKILL
jgi:hypothetical protein